MVARGSKEKQVAADIAHVLASEQDDEQAVQQIAYLLLETIPKKGLTDEERADIAEAAARLAVAKL